MFGWQWARSVLLGTDSVLWSLAPLRNHPVPLTYTTPHLSRASVASCVCVYICLLKVSQIARKIHGELQYLAGFKKTTVFLIENDFFLSLEIKNIFSSTSKVKELNM